MSSSSSSKPRKPTVTNIGGIPIEFPFQPYGSQLSFMSRVIATLDRAQRDGHFHALLESPTGTGKSLSLLCSVIAWQKNHKAKLTALLYGGKADPEAMADVFGRGGGFVPEAEPSGEINLELQSGTHKMIEKLSQEKVSQEEALEKFKWKVERDYEIKVLGEVNVELECGTKKLREKLSQEEDSEEEALEEFNSTLDNILEKLSQEKDSPDDFYGFMYDTDDDDASISGKSCEHFGWDWDSPGIEVDWQDDPLHETEDFFVGLDQSIQVVVVQNNVQQEVAGEVVLYPPIDEDVAEEVIKMANDQAEALSDQEVADECLDDE
ncbi:putative ribonuclease H-like domain-containing protein [Tanacetum coccineum]